MRIVHFGKYYHPDTGGIESVTVSLARGAANEGNDVTVICFHSLSSISIDFIDKVRVVRYPIWKLINSQPLSIGYFFKCLSASRNADIVHIHFPNMVGALTTLFVRNRTRVLVHWHSDIVNKGLLGKLLRPLEYALLHRADVIVATSQQYADSSKSLVAFGSKVTVVPIGVSKHSQQNVTLELLLPFEERVIGKKIVLSIGRLVAYKGFDVLIKSAKYLRTDAVIVIVGGGPLQQELQDLIKLNGVEKQVVLAGRVSNNALNALFERAKLYCLSSNNRAEAFGVVLVEAMMHSLPIVATSIFGSGVPWVNANNVSGLNVPVDDPKALAEACNEILGSEELRCQYAKGARHRYETEFTEDKSVASMMKVYHNLIG